MCIKCKKTTASLMSLVFAVIFMLAFSFTFSNVAEASYHGWSGNAGWVLDQWDEIVPKPKAKWAEGNNVGLWLIEAEKKFVVKTDVEEPYVGAIMIMSGEKDGITIYYTAIIREITDRYIIIERLNQEGRPLKTPIEFTKLITKNRSFEGYIWPVLKEEYAKKPQNYPSSRIVTDPHYKGFRENWEGTPILKEFDKIAPVPGVNWTGPAHTWVFGADLKGWKTSKDPAAAKVGALIIRADTANDKTWIGIIREVTERGVVAEYGTSSLNPSTYALEFEELPGKNFVGYIYPERK